METAHLTEPSCPIAYRFETARSLNYQLHEILKTVVAGRDLFAAHKAPAVANAKGPKLFLTSFAKAVAYPKSIHR